MNPTTAFLKRHSLVLGIVLMFLFTWPLDLVNTGIVKLNIPFIVLLFLGWGFGIASVLMTGLTLGKEAVFTLMKRYFQWHVNWKWYLAALFLEPLLIIVGVYGNVLVTGVAPDFSGIMAYKIFGKDATLWFFVVPFFLTDLIANGEEMGWRGYVLPRLQAKYSALTSALLVGVIWGFWHLLKYLTHWNTLLFVLSMIHAIAFSVTLAWLYNNTRGSLLLTAMMHASSNTAGLFFPMANTALSENLGAYAGWVLLEVIAAVIVVISAGPEHLSRTEEMQVQE
jgi:membrane protease YdiL (CAAX protease family)